jgi:hypothetical protein
VNIPDTSLPNMTGSNPAGGVVFVTETDYITVYPTAAMPETTLAKFSTMVTSYKPATTRSLASSTMASDTSISSRIVATSSLSSTLSSATRSSITAAPTIPSESAAASPYPKGKLWDDKLATLSLTIIILLALMLLALLIYAIYQRSRRRCHSCVDNEKLLEKYKTGRIKYISPAMVKIREKSSGSGGFCPRSDAPPSDAPRSASPGSDADLEKGEGDLSCAEKQEQGRARAEAMAKLVAPEPATLFMSPWERAKFEAHIVFATAKNNLEKAMGKGKEPASPTAAPDTERTIAGSVYSETPIQPVRRTYPPHPLRQVQTHPSDPWLDRAYDPPSPPNVQNPPSPPSPSIYSRPGLSDVGRQNQYRNQQQEQEQHYVPSGPVLHKSSPTLPATMYPAYLESQKKRRSGTYGGLPQPEDFEEIDIRGHR